MRIGTDKPIVQNTIFFLFLLGMATAYNYWEILPHKPYSMHQWRQTDALSLTVNYFKEGMNFFSPKIHLQESVGGKAVGEFPIIYYINAFIWQITGQNHFTPRLLTILFSFTGLFCLFRLGMNVFKKLGWALIPPLFLFLSPIFIFYSNNFLVNIPALSCVFIGWFFISQFVKTTKNKYLIFTGLIFSLAGLLRVTMLSGLIPFGIIYFLERTSLLQKEHTKKNLWVLFTLGLPVIVNGAWVLWMKHYNIVNGSTYFFTSTNPIWTPWGNKDMIWDYILFHRLPEFYQGYILAIIFLSTFIILLFNKLVNRYLLTIFFTIGVITISYFLLWFNQFNHHDYYYIDYYLYTVCSSFLFLHLLKTQIPHSLNLKMISFVLGIFFVYSTFYASIKHRLRYEYVNNFVVRSFVDSKEMDRTLYKHDDYKKKINRIESINPVLRKLDIDRTDLVISLPDISSNISLYFMDQKGFTDIYTPQSEDFTTRQKVDRHIMRGAQYLICYENGLVEKENLLEVIESNIFTTRNGLVSIYKLKKTK